MDPSNLSNVTANATNTTVNATNGTTVSDVLAPLTNFLSPVVNTIMSQPGVSETVTFSVSYFLSMPHNILVNGDVADWKSVV